MGKIIGIDLEAGEDMLKEDSRIDDNEILGDVRTTIRKTKLTTPEKEKNGDSWIE